MLHSIHRTFYTYVNEVAESWRDRRMSRGSGRRRGRGEVREKRKQREEDVRMDGGVNEWRIVLS